MDIILLKDVDTLGLAGDIVAVKPGYARNYLIPRGMALRASKRNLAVSEEKKRVKQARIERSFKIQKALADKLAKTELTLEVQVGEEEKLFGSITTQDIHKALEDKGLNVDRHAIVLDEPIKALGVYNIPVKITAELQPEIKMYVIRA
ncbi:MAG: 50S ribosomal protein L9 [Candidatus Marinimicrobia bacterium]|nr:50S ribosomal protein L9 [Candidatus Neomarinimicrobiota bacterium]MBL7060086.1 50S ribosomal protein L9 [Candidatus Neomarinimicrobiota bacterium]